MGKKQMYSLLPSYFLLYIRATGSARVLISASLSIMTTWKREAWWVRFGHNSNVKHLVKSSRTSSARCWLKIHPREYLSRASWLIPGSPRRSSQAQRKFSYRPQGYSTSLMQRSMFGALPWLNTGYSLMKTTSCLDLEPIGVLLGTMKILRKKTTKMRISVQISPISIQKTELS